MVFRRQGEGPLSPFSDSYQSGVPECFGLLRSGCFARRVANGRGPLPGEMAPLRLKKSQNGIYDETSEESIQMCGEERKKRRSRMVPLCVWEALWDDEARWLPRAAGRRIQKRRKPGGRPINQANETTTWEWHGLFGEGRRRRTATGDGKAMDDRSRKEGRHCQFINCCLPMKGGFPKFDTLNL